MAQKTRKNILIAAAFAASFGAGFVANQAVADQPLMHQALDQLRGARETLSRADSDKGGHREKAIADIDAAIDEVKAGIGFDRVH
jgi:hypothetical protein